MGCDAHLIIEVYEAYSDNNKWDCVSYHTNWIAGDDEEKSIPYTGMKIDGLSNDVYISRNYYLFSLLADVCGSADDDNPPINGRTFGLPNDISMGAENVLKSWGSDAHTPVHFLLKDLLEHDWARLMEDERNMTDKEYDTYSYSGVFNGYLSSPDFVMKILTPEQKKYCSDELEKIINSRRPRKINITLSDCVPQFHKIVIPELIKYMKHFDSTPEKTRIIIFFDN